MIQKLHRTQSGENGEWGWIEAYPVQYVQPLPLPMVERLHIDVNSLLDEKRAQELAEYLLVWVNRNK